jgi:hypothetical protein
MVLKWMYTFVEWLRHGQPGAFFGVSLPGNELEPDMSSQANKFSQPTIWKGILSYVLRHLLELL